MRRGMQTHHEGISSVSFSKSRGKYGEFSFLNAGSVALGSTLKLGRTSREELGLVWHGAISGVEVGAGFKQQQQEGAGVDGPPVR